MRAGPFRTLVQSEEAWDTLVRGNIISSTAGVVEFQLRALAWYFSTI